MMRIRLSIVFLLTGFAFSSGLFANEQLFLKLDSRLDTGRQIWLGTCASCHGYGIAGAPNPTQARAWEKRIDKPISELYYHAINGFFGPGDTYMPPRGGNDDLSDADLQQAVDYMLGLAKYYIDKEEKRK